MNRLKLLEAALVLLAVLVGSGCGSGSSKRDDVAANSAVSTTTMSTARKGPAPSSTGAPMTTYIETANPMVGGAAMFPDKSIVVNAQAAGNLSTLVAAVTEAGLVAKLASPGPFTVFAPTNKAFSKMPAATLQELLRPANQAALKDVLAYHIVPGTLRAADLTDGEQLTTLSGAKLKVTRNGDVVRINGAVLLTADVRQSNGIVHVIDSVLMPPTSSPTI